MKSLNNIKEALATNKETKRVVLTTVHKYGLEKDNEIRVWFSHHSGEKNMTITNLNTMSDKHYDTEDSFYSAIARLIKKQ